jgi:hypothetical protein
VDFFVQAIFAFGGHPFCFASAFLALLTVKLYQSIYFNATVSSLNNSNGKKPILYDIIHTHVKISQKTLL